MPPLVPTLRELPATRRNCILLAVMALDLFGSVIAAAALAATLLPVDLPLSTGLIFALGSEVLSGFGRRWLLLRAWDTI